MIEIAEIERTDRERFCELYKTFVTRDGSEELMRWLETGDFFEAPASTRFHLCEPGGLCRHSLDVYARLVRFLMVEYPDGTCPYSDETIAVVALLHDLCKVNFYRGGFKNQKTYDEVKVAEAPGHSVKHDALGDFIWESVPTYEVAEKFIYGHGEKSVFIIMNFMPLKPEEAQAIRYHMGAWRGDEARDFGNCCEVNPLAFFLHIADSAATFLDEPMERKH